MHKFFTAATKSSGVLHCPCCTTRKRVPLGLLNVLKSTFAGARGTRLRVTRLVRAALSSLRDKNLCITRASAMKYLEQVFVRITEKVIRQ